MMYLPSHSMTDKIDESGSIWAIAAFEIRTKTSPYAKAEALS